MRQAFDLEFQGFRTFQQMLKGEEFALVFKRKLLNKNKRLVALGSAKLANTIRSGRFHPNSAVTNWVKKSRVPLLDHGDLVGSVSGSVNSAEMSFSVGTNRRTPSGKNLAHMLETGFTIKVTPKMRKLFFAWSRESGGKIKPLKKSTTAIRVRPRPFMRMAFFDDKEFQSTVQTEWLNAIHETFKHFVEKSKKDKS